ncbi:MAG TPA: MATE family efflux transporter [Chitinophagaceae bacterium]|nr:MATE family efflux transporter [Chitinophagaceae bacterium]
MQISMATGSIQDLDLRMEISRKHILQLALPISAAILVPQINYITNNIFLSWLGKEELGAAGITGVFYLVFGTIGYGLNNGLQALIARRAGENRPEEIGRLFSQAVRIALVIAAVGIVITWFLAPMIFNNVLHNDENVNRVISFLKIRIWGLPFLYIYQMRNALLVGTNQSRYLIIGTLAETITNIVLDYGLIFGNLGLPELGFNGAAYASVIAEATGMFVVLGVIHVKGIGKRFHIYSNLKFDKVTSKLLLVQSSPLIFQYAISLISWEFFFILVERNASYNYDLAISNMMRNIFGFFGVFTWAFAATSSTMVSNIIGQKRNDEVQPLIMKIVQLSTGLSVMVCIVLNIFPETILGIFGQDPGFISHAIPVLRIVSVAMILMSFSTVWLNAVVGTGNSKINLMIEAVTVVLYSIYVYVVLEKLRLPITWAWGSEWLYWTSMFIPSFLYIRSGRWRGKVI